MFILLKPNLQPKLKFPISVKIESIYTLNKEADKTPPCLQPLQIVIFSKNNYYKKLNQCYF